jgi:hypothetical protein
MLWMTGSTLLTWFVCAIDATRTADLLSNNGIEPTGRPAFV